MSISSLFGPGLLSDPILTAAEYSSSVYVGIKEYLSNFYVTEMQLVPESM